MHNMAHDPYNHDRPPKRGPDFLPSTEDATGARSGRHNHVVTHDGDKSLFTDTGLPTWLVPAHQHTLPVYDEGTWREIIERVMCGEPMKSICADGRMPNLLPLMRYMKHHPERREEYNEARRMAAEVHLEPAMVNASDGKDEKGNETLEDTARSALRVKTYQFLLKAWDRERYGEKKDVDITVGVNLVNAMDEAERRVERVIEHDG